MADTSTLQRGAAAARTLPNFLTVRHCSTRKGDPLAIVDGLPGDSAELQPAQLRALACALIEAADDCEGLPVHRDTSRNVRDYRLQGATRQDVRWALDPAGPRAAGQPDREQAAPVAEEGFLTGREFIAREVRDGHLAADAVPALQAAFDAIERQPAKAEEKPSGANLSLAADSASALWFSINEISAVGYAIELVQEHTQDPGHKADRIYALSRAVRELCGTAINHQENIEEALRAA